MAAYAALVSVMHIIDDLELHPRPPISLRKNQVYLLTQNITFLQEFLEVYNPHLAYSTEADPLESRIADAAYAAEDVIESHIVDRITNDEENISSDDVLYEALEKVIQDMALIQKEAMEIKETMEHQLGTKSTPPDSLGSSSSVAEKRSMVGADELLLEMKDKLTSDRPNLQIIPITGMGGSGKTTLARNIYQDRLIKEYFHIRAWVTISQEYSIPEILQQLLKQLDQQVSQHLGKGELGHMLYKHLYGRKYLIILDDMWTIEAWDRVRWFLPDNKNGSRIVITTRLSDLASELHNSYSLRMKLLDEADSWDLLSKTIFGEKGCPLELEDVGKEIGKSCKGLPLSIVVVGGFLTKSKQTIEFWKHIEENLNSIVNLEENERCLKILHMSYKQLPVYLKPCFLYMGVYPEDEVIRISRLVKLWVAEGFLKPIIGKRLEEIAKEYLEDLIGRNLILTHKLGAIGSIKECKIHDLLRDLCLREAEKERFYTCQGIVSGQRRIVISSTTTKNEAINDLSSMPLVHSLIWNLEREELPPLNFRLLRVLESCRLKSTVPVRLVETMHNLVNTRFLALTNYVDNNYYSFPFSMELFWNLQTLIVREHETVPPPYIWYMHRIRHVDFPELHCLDPPNNQDGIVLGNLQTLVGIMKFNCQVVKIIPNVKKLRLYYDTEFDDDCYNLSNLDCLDKLESLTCSFSEEMYPSGPEYEERPDSAIQSLINFPHSLKKLSLRIVDCWQDILDKIGSLPLLQKLKLQEGWFKEGKWETTEGQFRSLKFLVVHWCSGLQVWTTESSHFPCLEHLILHHLTELKEIPLDFAEMSTLGVIEVNGCSDSAVESAKRIVDEQEELYGEEEALQVQVTLDEKNEAIESLASPNFRIRLEPRVGTMFRQ